MKSRATKFTGLRPSPPSGDEGFGLVQVIIFVGLLSVMIYFAAVNISRSRDMSASFQGKLGHWGVAGEALSVVSRSVTCASALTNTAYNLDGEQKMSFPLSLGGERRVASGANLKKSDGIEVESFIFQKKFDMGTMPSGVQVVYGELSLKANAKSGRALAYKEGAVAKVFLHVQAGNIVKCQSGEDPSDMANQACLLMGGIYHGPGNCEM